MIHIQAVALLKSGMARSFFISGPAGGAQGTGQEPAPSPCRPPANGAAAFHENPMRRLRELGKGSTPSGWKWRVQHFCESVPVTD
jgi:hypothetical protein